MAWTRLRVDRACGFCGHVVRAEAPIYQLRGSASCRCEDCAEKYFRTTPPAGLAPVAPPPVYAPPSAFVPVGVVARASATLLPFDARMRQAGREPGEDG